MSRQMSLAYNSFAYKGLLMQGPTVLKAGVAVGGAGALILSSLASTKTSHADSIDSAGILKRACEEASLSSKWMGMIRDTTATLWDIFLKPMLMVFHPVEVIKTFAYNFLLHVSITYNAYMAELIDHEQAAAEAEAESLLAPDPPPIPDFKPSFNRSLTATFRDLCKKAVVRLYQGCVIVRIGFSRAQALIKNHVSWLRETLLPRLKGGHKSELFKQVFSLLMHTQALLFLAELTVSVVQATARIMRDRHLDSKDKIVKVTRSLAAQSVRCSILYCAASFSGAAGICLGNSVSHKIYGMQIAMMLTDLCTSILISPLVMVISGF